MAIWPFNRIKVENLPPEELQQRLITAAFGPKRALRALCNQYKDQIAANVDCLCKASEAMKQVMETDPTSVERFVQGLGVVAQCLATECNAPEMWNKLCGTPDDNPLLMWDRWYSELPQRIERLEYDALISEARSFIERSKTLRGPAARQHEALLQGRLGELLFHSGKVSDAIEPCQSALKLCQEADDIEGQLVYLNNLLEAHRYLGNTAVAVSTGETLLQLLKQLGRDTDHLTKQVKRLREGEPLCRLVCCKDNAEFELDEIPVIGEGCYQFQFRRNRLSLRRATAVAQQGRNLASNGQLADALEKFQEACEIDPYDPDPLYQSGVCLLELGAYRKAKEAFEEVEQLAPGWFRCRSDIWLAESLENGTISDEEFRLLRLLDDGSLAPADAIQIAGKAVGKYPDFAPFYLSLGDLQKDRNETDAAIASYRRGLELAVEPDLETRLLCALAGALPKKAAERSTLIERALRLKGSLVAQACAKLM